jgi:predicted nucleic acid-binding protein
VKAAFVDTAGWMMLADGADPEHEAARRWRDLWLEDGGAFVTTDYVVDETLTLLRMRLDIGAAEKWWNAMGESRRVRWEPVDAERAERARAWFFRWKDHDFSFTDCTSFVVMRELRLRQALTSGGHFQIAGFETLPGTAPRRKRTPRARRR